MANTFEVDIINELGLDERKFKAKLAQLAVTSPADYVDLYDQVMDQIVHKLVKETYDKFRTMLTQGDNNINAGGVVFVPKVAASRANKKAMELAESMLKTIEDILEDIIPASYKDIALDKTRGITSAKLRGI
jgi:hypothetical protein